MKQLLAISLLVLLGSFASNANAADSRVMSCSSTKSLVSSRGEAIIYYGDDLFDRFVAHEGYCYRDQIAVPAWLPTRDSSSCFVGYTCQERTGD